MFEMLATLGAAFAVVCNLLAASRAVGPWRRVYLIVAAFSVMYVVGWGWLLVFPDTDRGAWSEHITPVSVMSFFIVWGGPALISYFNNHPKEDEE